jgi:hypothetical protein
MHISQLWKAFHNGYYWSFSLPPYFPYLYPHLAIDLPGIFFDFHKGQPRLPSDYHRLACQVLHGGSCGVLCPSALPCPCPAHFPAICYWFSLFRLARRNCPPWQSGEDLPRSLCCFDNMPCSQTPGMPGAAALIAMPDGVFWIS